MKLVVYSIVLDGAPFVGWMLPVLNRLTIPWEYIICEGAAMAVKDTSWCRPQQPRLSRDGTTELLNSLREHPRIKIIQRQQWNGKVEQCNACLAEIKEPCILLQCDIDEQYTAGQLERLVKLFEAHPEARCADFYCRFFVGPNLIVTHESDMKNNRWRRSWRFSPGQIYAAHEPPILSGSEHPVISRDETYAAGIVMDHYAYVFHKQLEYKSKFYPYPKAVEQWLRLQRNTQWPAHLKSFLPWAHANSMADLLHR